jgi:hypothetical protein
LPMKRAASSSVASSTPGPRSGSITRVSLRLKSASGASAHTDLTPAKFEREVSYADHRIDPCASIRATLTLTGPNYSIVNSDLASAIRTDLVACSFLRVK